MVGRKSETLVNRFARESQPGPKTFHARESTKSPGHRRFGWQKNVRGKLQAITILRHVPKPSQRFVDGGQGLITGRVVGMPAIGPWGLHVSTGVLGQRCMVRGQGEVTCSGGVKNAVTKNVFLVALTVEDLRLRSELN